MRDDEVGGLVYLGGEALDDGRGDADEVAGARRLHAEAEQLVDNTRLSVAGSRCR